MITLGWPLTFLYNGQPWFLYQTGSQVSNTGPRAGDNYFSLFPHVNNHVYSTQQVLDNMSRDMTKWVCTQRRLRSAWAPAQSDQRLCCGLNGQLRTQTFFMRTAKTNQTGRMPKLIWVFTGRTAILLVCHVVAHMYTWNLDVYAPTYKIYMYFHPDVPFYFYIDCCYSVCKQMIFLSFKN